MRMSCETQIIDCANAARRALLQVGTCEGICILTDHIAFCHPAAVLIKLTHFDVTGASLTFNFAHRCHSSKRPAAFLARFYPPSLDPGKGALSWALNLFSGNLAVEAFHAFYCSSQAPARMSFRRIPDSGPAGFGLKYPSSTASFLSQLVGQFISSEHGYLEGDMGLLTGRHARTLTRHCACLGNTGRCNSREPTAITFPDW